MKDNKKPKSTIYKVDMQISDMNRHYYEQHSLTLGRHPEESDVYLLSRILAFALFADEKMSYTKGLYEPNEPALWQKGYSGDTEVWIEIGCPDEKRIKKAGNAADKVVIVTYANKAEQWWNAIENRLSFMKNCTILSLPPEKLEELSLLLDRTMQMQITIEGTHLWVNMGEQMIEIEPSVLLGEL